MAGEAALSGALNCWSPSVTNRQHGKDAMDTAGVPSGTLVSVYSSTEETEYCVEHKHPGRINIINPIHYSNPLTNARVAAAAEEQFVWSVLARSAPSTGVGSIVTLWRAHWYQWYAPGTPLTYLGGLRLLLGPCRSWRLSCTSAMSAGTGLRFPASKSQQQAKGPICVITIGTC